MGKRRAMRFPAVVVLFASALAFALSTTVFAHPGRTDSSGGHNDRETGEYHYHHGFEAHQHVNGKCPFDFVDMTGQNKGGDGNNSTGTYKGDAGEPYGDLKNERSPYKDFISLILFALFAFLGPTLLVYIFVATFLSRGRIGDRWWPTMWVTFPASVCFAASVLFAKHKNILIIAGAAILIIHFLVCLEWGKGNKQDTMKEKEAELKKASAEQSNKVNVEDGRHIVYITQGGRLYHSSRACPYLARSKKVATIYEDQALRRGRRKCPKCTKP